MADHIRHSVHITPIEELTDEQGNTIKIISGEVNTSLGGSGDSVDLANYSGAGSAQGYTGGAVNYLDMTHSTGGTQIRGSGVDFIFIKNTGFKFSSTSVLGSSTTDCILVVLKEVAYNSGVDGGFRTAGDANQDHFYEIGWLKPGEAIILPSGGLSVDGNLANKFGSNTNDLSYIGQISQNGQARVFGRTYQSNGNDASDGNALEFLAVT